MNDITCLAIGDPHFQTNNIIECEELINKINKIIKKLKPTFVVVLGDLLHTHEKIHVSPFNMATKFITSLAEKVPTYLLIGNHDYCNNQQFLSDKHPFNSFKNINNVFVCDKIILDYIDDMKFIFCPYVPPKRFIEALSTLKNDYIDEKWEDATCIFAHQEFYGCQLNPVMKSIDGDIWDEQYPLVISGHIHDEQLLQSNVYYTGSSMQHGFGEKTNKTISLITFYKNKKFKINKIDLEMKKKKIIYLDVEDIDKFKPDANYKIKLVLQGNPEEFKIFRKSKIYKEIQEKGIPISFSPKSYNINMENNIDLYKLEKKSFINIFEDLIKNENNYVKEIFNELIKNDKS
jgi:DNA repair exonuclease SbcCD nuclease subunit